MSRETYVIVGANLAGGAAAATLREEGFDGRVVLIGAEPHPPYERPPLSKEYLRGEVPAEKTFLHPPEWWPDNGIETLFGTRVSRLDTAAKRAVLEGGDDVGYDKILIATGGRNRRFPIPGLDSEGVCDLRTIGDADRIRAEMAPGKKAVVVGMGFIGAEVTASLRSSGVEVTAIEPFRVPLARVLGEDVGRVVAAIHADHGVKTVFEDVVTGFEGSGRVERVVTKEGRKIDCDFAVVGVGIQPNVEIVEGTDVEVDNGIVVDELCRTNVEGVYAAGDVARHRHPLFGAVRVEHWQNALKHGPAAARSMLGKGVPYDEVHWFWSDQYDENIQYAGFHMAWDDLVIRGDLAARNFVGFYVKDGVVLAAVGFNRGRDVKRTIGIIKARTVVDPAKLGDEDVDLRTLAV